MGFVILWKWQKSWHSGLTGRKFAAAVQKARCGENYRKCHELKKVDVIESEEGKGKHLAEQCWQQLDVENIQM